MGHYMLLSLWRESQDLGEVNLRSTWELSLCTFTWWAALWGKQARGQGTSLPRRGADLAPHPAKMWTFCNQSLVQRESWQSPIWWTKARKTRLWTWWETWSSPEEGLHDRQVPRPSRRSSMFEPGQGPTESGYSSRITHTFQVCAWSFPREAKIKDLLPHRRNACCPRLAVESIPVCLFLHGGHEGICLEG